MTLFGQTFDGQQVFSLVSLIAVLALWLMVLAGRREHLRFFTRRKPHRRPRADGPPAAPGPWG